MSEPAEPRLVALLEQLLLAQQEARDAHAREWTRHAQALDAQHACTRRVVRWFGAFILAFGAIAAFVVARPSLAWLLAG